MPPVGVMVRVQDLYDTLKSALKKVADLIQREPETAINVSISEVAAACGVSQGSITRFCRTLGFKGFQDFKIALAREIGFPEAPAPALGRQEPDFEQPRFYNFAY